MELNEALENTEHIAHAAHGEDHGHDAHNRLGMYVGITMACLGVMLAFCAAKVGGERTELVQKLVEQSDATAQYHAQDVKHRVAFLDLQQLHAAAMSANGGDAINRDDVVAMADTVDRYLGESDLAHKFAASYDPAIQAHIKAQEHYEIGQLLAEIGIVIASVALLLKNRIAWIIALLLGLGCLGTVIVTYVATSREVQASETKIEETGKEFFEARTKNKTTAQEQAMIADIRAWASKPKPLK
jgi:hypothetical protein